MFKHAKKLVVPLSFLIMSGCSMIPGSHMEGIDSETETLEQDLSNVNVEIIDSVLISKLKKQQTPRQIKAYTPLNIEGYDYVLGIGDVLSIAVWDHPELTIPAAVQRTASFDGFRIQADGTVTYAYAENIPAAGKTVKQLHTLLVKEISKVIEKPQLDLKIVAFRSQRAYLTGEVNKPGTYPINEIPLTLIDAINQAGGLSERADWRTVNFTRNNKTETIKLDDFYTKGDFSQNRLLQHGDIIHVSRTDNQKIFVLGDVNKAGSIEISRYGISLAEALSDVGGLNERTANANGVFVLRKRLVSTNGNGEANNESKNSENESNEENTEQKAEATIIADVYQLHAQNVVALVLADQFKLQPRDIVYVTTAPIARWNRLISQLVPTIAGLQDISSIAAQESLF
jgi:polysaccharide export outer membrane protein